jgi:hypothetical protein
VSATAITGGLDRAPRAARRATLERTTLLVGALTLGVLLLRASQLHQSLYGDEMWTYSDVVGHGLSAAIHRVNVGVENNPPLYFILAWLSAKLGDPLVTLRLPTLLFGTATVPVVYLLGRETVGRRAGAVGAAIVGLGPFTTFYGVEARPYATMAFFVALSTLAVVRALRTGASAWWAAYAVAVAGAAYSHYTAIFALAVQAGWSLWTGRARLRAALIANVAAVALYLPWIDHVSGKSLNVFGLIEPLTAGNVLDDLARSIAGYPFASLSAIPTVVGGLVLAITVGVALAWSLSHVRRRRPAPAQVLVVLMAVATPVGLLLYSELGTDLWTARCLSASIPAAALVIAWLLTELPGGAEALAVTAVLATLLVATITSLEPGYARPPFHAAAVRLDRLAAPDDPILMFPSLSNMAPSIEAEFGRRHAVIADNLARWPAGLPDRPAFVVIDDTVARILKIRWPRPSGYALESARIYRGLFPFTVLAYRPLARPAAP